MKKRLGVVVVTELEIAVAPMHRLCKKAGADRVSEAAAKELAKALEEIGVKIAKEASGLCHACWKKNHQSRRYRNRR